ncbi:MAG: hypothetical protein QNK03_15540 [Myxococcota bacterium]|nr:hypothetical protein [Myxococcota bacterium]
MLTGYRGFLREMARTGSFQALWLQVRTGALHAARRALRLGGGDPVARFFDHYAADGYRASDPARAALQLAAERCLVCGLCSLECARVGGAPDLDPRDAVVSASRLEIDWARLGLAPTDSGCRGCAACNAVCPAGIPIDRVQDALAAELATPPRIR